MKRRTKQKNAKTKNKKTPKRNIISEIEKLKKQINFERLQKEFQPMLDNRYFKEEDFMNQKMICKSLKKLDKCLVKIIEARSILADLWS